MSCTEDVADAADAVAADAVVSDAAADAEVADAAADAAGDPGSGIHVE